MFLGADTEAMRALAQMLVVVARALAARGASMRAQAEGLAWEGPDGDVFREAMRALAQRWEEIARAVEGAAQQLEVQAAQQDATSAPDAGARGQGADGHGPREMHPPGSAARPGVQEPPFLGMDPEQTRTLFPLPGGVQLPLGVDPEAAHDLARSLREAWDRVVDGSVRYGADAAPLGAPLSDRLRDIGHAVSAPDPGPSQGLIGDAAGPEAAKRWNDLEIAVAGAGRLPGLGAIPAMAVDAVDAAAGRYEEVQGVREGDVLQVGDGAITRGLAQADMAAKALEFTPAAPEAAALSLATGKLTGAWAGLRHDALADPDAQGSPLRYVLQTPTRVNEEYVQPAAGRLGGPVGEAIGRAGDEVAAGQQHLERTHDELGRTLSEAAQDRVPGLRPALAAPRTLVEAPRHAVQEVRGG